MRRRYIKLRRRVRNWLAKHHLIQLHIDRGYVLHMDPRRNPP